MLQGPCVVHVSFTSAALEAAVVADVGLIMFRGPWAVHVRFTSAAEEAAVVADVGRIMFHGPWVVHVSFTSAAVEALLVANAGHIVFHGPREDVVEFFESCGFCCPERKGVPDFLQEVTSKNDQKVSSLLLHAAKPGHRKTVFSSLLVYVI